jgi:hypothetical protein
MHQHQERVQRLAQGWETIGHSRALHKQKLIVLAWARERLARLQALRETVSRNRKSQRHA